MLAYPGAVQKKVTQRLRGYRYLKSIVADTSNTNKAAIRYLFGTVFSGGRWTSRQKLIRIAPASLRVSTSALAGSLQSSAPT